MRLGACDAYVSLHRSEGYGLVMAEAMAGGKPVLATGYSGNLDFMTGQNSLLVGHRLIELEADHGPYRRGAVWAEPDVNEAAEHMRRLVERTGLGACLGAQARRDVERDLNPEKVGGLIRARLMELQVSLVGNWKKAAC